MEVMDEWDFARFELKSSFGRMSYMPTAWDVTRKISKIIDPTGLGVNMLASLKLRRRPNSTAPVRLSNLERFGKLRISISHFRDFVRSYDVLLY